TCAVFFSSGPNESQGVGDESGLVPEENPDDASALDQSSRDFLDGAIRDYNEMFKTNYSTDGERFQSYYKDVSLRMKNKELDMLIVVNMFLTGFDATTLNTLWVDKNLKMHGLIQAFSRTNRILNSVKTFGNIVCFRNLKKRVDDAIALFGDREAGGVVLMRRFEDYYYGYEDEKGRKEPGYEELVERLDRQFPLGEQIVGEKEKRDFLRLFGAILRMRNLLSSFDEFAGKELLSERDFQDYTGQYQDIWHEIRPRPGDKTDITDDIVYEIELIRQVEVNIDYILVLVAKYHESHCRDKEVLATIRKAVGASPQLRSKKQLIDDFIGSLNGVDDVMDGWRAYVSEKREKELADIISQEGLKEPETRRFMENAFREGEIRTSGMDLDRLLPPSSLFTGARAEIRQKVTRRLKAFFEKFFGVGETFKAEPAATVYHFPEETMKKVAEDIDYDS
ncbi:MAG: type I restriction endonuclease subunit R, partial [Clostridiales bacterium]|nr:type I restriction endonuclease subunit R [Clostridiales bacterium]